MRLSATDRTLRLRLSMQARKKIISSRKRILIEVSESSFTFEKVPVLRDGTYIGPTLFKHTGHVVSSADPNSTVVHIRVPHNTRMGSLLLAINVLARDIPSILLIKFKLDIESPFKKKS